jgi:hypothetical protein
MIWSYRTGSKQALQCHGNNLGKDDNRLFLLRNLRGEMECSFFKDSTPDAEKE